MNIQAFGLVDGQRYEITVNRSGAVRRVVQIVETDSRLTALCSDGSIWVTYNDNKWHEITPPPGCDHVEAP